MTRDEERFWQLYRDERRKLVLAQDPGCKQPFRVELTPAATVRCARQARARLDAEQAAS